MTLTIDTLTAEAPELLANIRQQAAADERARVCAILDADGDVAATRTAIADGLSEAAAYKLFYQAEKQLKADRLSQLEAQAAPVVGAEAPPDAPPRLAADQELANKAAALAAVQNLVISAATRLVLTQDDDLARRYAENLIH